MEGKKNRRQEDKKASSTLAHFTAFSRPNVTGFQEELAVASTRTCKLNQLTSSYFGAEAVLVTYIAPDTFI